MARYGLLVLATPKAGREEDYTRWHQNVHVPEIMETPGFLSCTRFRLAKVQRAPGSHSWRFMSLYEIESDDLAATLNEMKKRSDAGTRTDASNPENTVILTWDQVSKHFPHCTATEGS